MQPIIFFLAFSVLSLAFGLWAVNLALKHPNLFLGVLAIALCVLADLIDNFPFGASPIVTIVLDGMGIILGIVTGTVAHHIIHRRWLHEDAPRPLF